MAQGAAADTNRGAGGAEGVREPSSARASAVGNHAPVRWDDLATRPRAGEEEMALEAWLEDRIAAHADLARQRAVRGDRWFLGALHSWDVRNTHELLTKVAPELVSGYRGDPPGHPPGQETKYYDRQVDWLRRTLKCLRRASDARESELLVRLYREGEQLRARILVSSSSLVGDLIRGTANERQMERERAALDWSDRVAEALADDFQATWSAVATLPERRLDPGSTIAGVRAFLATKLACLKEIISEV